MLKRIPLAACVAFFLSGCALFVEDATNEDVRAVAEPPELVLTNRTDEPVYTFVVGKRALSHIRWGPSVGGESLAPGADMRLSYADLQKGEEEVVVHWWHAVEEDGARVPGDVRSFVVEL